MEHRVHLRSYGLTMAAACTCLLSPRDLTETPHEYGVPFLIVVFRSVLASAPFAALCALDPHFCRARTGASSAADFYPTVKAALRHESVDSEEDR